MPKSGKPWKKGSKKFFYFINRHSDLYKKNKGLGLSWEKKEKVREKKKANLEIVRK